MSDLDGTLLNDNKEISPYTKQVLTELQQCGHYVMIATGRPYRASQMYYHELNMNTPVVNFNEHLHHPKANDFEVIHEVLDVEISKNIITALQQSHITNIIAEVKIMSLSIVMIQDFLKVFLWGILKFKRGIY